VPRWRPPTAHPRGAGMPPEEWPREGPPSCSRDYFHFLYPYRLLYSTNDELYSIIFRVSNKWNSWIWHRVRVTFEFQSASPALVLDAGYWYKSLHVVWAVHLSVWLLIILGSCTKHEPNKMLFWEAETRGLNRGRIIWGTYGSNLTNTIERSVLCGKKLSK